MDFVPSYKLAMLQHSLKKKKYATVFLILLFQVLFIDKNIKKALK